MTRRPSRWCHQHVACARPRVFDVLFLAEPQRGLSQGSGLDSRLAVFFRLASFSRCSYTADCNVATVRIRRITSLSVSPPSLLLFVPALHFPSPPVSSLCSSEITSSFSLSLSPPYLEAMNHFSFLHPHSSYPPTYCFQTSAPPAACAT